MDEVRERALAVLETADLSGAGDALNANGLVWDMLVAHEQQHNETMLQTLSLAELGVYSPPRRSVVPATGAGAPARDMVRVPGRPFAMAAIRARFGYDQERPRHEAPLPACA